MSKRSNKRKKAAKRRQERTQKKKQTQNAVKKKQAEKVTEEQRQRKEVAKMFSIGQGGKMSFVERIWAEDGLVCAARRDGIVRRFTVRQAAQRAGQLNEMVKNPAITFHMSEDTVKETFEFIEKIIQACREAQAQSEDPKDKKTALLHNVMNGKDEDGNPIVLEELPKDFFIEGFMKEFHTLDQREVEVIMAADDKWPRIEQKRTAMRTIHAKRLQEMAGEPV